MVGVTMSPTANKYRTELLPPSSKLFHGYTLSHAQTFLRMKKESSELNTYSILVQCTKVLVLQPDCRTVSTSSASLEMIVILLCKSQERVNRLVFSKRSFHNLG